MQCHSSRSCPGLRQMLVRTEALCRAVGRASTPRSCLSYSPPAARAHLHAYQNHRNKDQYNGTVVCASILPGSHLVPLTPGAGPCGYFYEQVGTLNKVSFLSPLRMVFAPVGPLSSACSLLIGEPQSQSCCAHCKNASSLLGGADKRGHPGSFHFGANMVAH